jgi:hypothetical protein
MGGGGGNRQQLDDVLRRCLIDGRDVERLTYLPSPWNQSNYMWRGCRRPRWGPAGTATSTHVLCNDAWRDSRFFSFGPCHAMQIHSYRYHVYYSYSCSYSYSSYLLGIHVIATTCQCHTICLLRLRSLGAHVVHGLDCNLPTRRAQPSLRFRIADIVELVVCACGCA